MADPAAFPPKTLFTSNVVLETGQETVYGSVQFAFDPGEYPSDQTVNAADIAGAIRNLFVGRGYTVSTFEAPITSSAQLDWPQEA